jgi:hypothetical protein
MDKFIKAKCITYTLWKLKTFALCKPLSKKRKGKLQTEEKIFANHISNKELVKNAPEKPVKKKSNKKMCKSH